MKKRQSRIARVRQLDARNLDQYRVNVMPMVRDMFKSLLRDIEKANPLYRDVDRLRDEAAILCRLESEGLGLLAKTLPNLIESLMTYLETGKSSYPGFKLYSRAEYPAFLGRLFREVYTKGQYHDMAFKQIYQVCVMFKKLNGPFRQSSLRKAERKFVEDDIKLSRLNLDSEITKPILDNAKKLIDRLFKGVTYSEVLRRLKPRPGPGATNTPVDKQDRFTPHIVYEQLEDEFWYPEWFYSFHHWDPHFDAKRYMSLPVREGAVSRFKWVPKYLFKPRGICIEENEMQFFQQALKDYLYSMLERHPLTRKNIRFTDQTANQFLALLGSMWPELATLDMSSASDNVWRVLVHRLFLDTPIFALLDAVSTRHITMPSGNTVFAHKFAPMGSGVCFPVMSMVHWALVTSIIQLTSSPDSFRDSKRVYVYGDDLIVPSKYCEAVYTYLPYFGMKLNETKSFYRGPFRESCGVHAINGVDVTPVYVNYVVKKDQQNSDVTTLLSLIAKESLFDKKGFHEVSQCIRRFVHSTFWILPFVGETSCLVGWRRQGRTRVEHVSSFARKRRYNADLQAPELSLQTIVPRKGPLFCLQDGVGLVRKLLTHAKDALTIAGNVEDLKVCRRWLTLSEL